MPPRSSLLRVRASLHLPSFFGDAPGRCAGAVSARCRVRCACAAGARRCWVCPHQCPVSCVFCPALLLRTQAAEAGPAKAKKGDEEELDPTKYFENRCGFTDADTQKRRH